MLAPFPVQREIAFMRFIAIALGMLVIAAGCATTSNHDLVDPGQPVTVTFIDTERFDRNLTNLMQNGHREIRVEFLGQVSINEMPPRLQSWLSHIDKFGHGYKIEQSSDDFVTKSPGLALALILRAVPFIRHNYRGEVSKPYGASLRPVSYTHLTLPTIYSV